jgi:hypothetical protein
MKTQTPAPARPQTTSGARLRRLAVVGLAAPALALTALAACSSEAPVTADPTASAPAATTPPAATSTSSDTSSPATATTSTAPPRTTYANVKTVIKDPTLGHVITATRIARNLTWPSGNPVASQEFEIVGVRVQAQAGDRYSASIDPSMLTLVAASPQQTVSPTSEFSERWQASPLQKVERGKTGSGWVFFKVNRGTTSYLRLAFNRPAYQVSTTDKKIDAHTFWAQLTR